MNDEIEVPGVPRIARTDRPESAVIRKVRQDERERMAELAAAAGIDLSEIIEQRSRWDAEGQPWSEPQP